MRDDIPIVMCTHLNMDVQAKVFGFDKGKDFDAMGWREPASSACSNCNQRSGDDGNVYQPGDWVADYYSNEQILFETNAGAWMMWWLYQRGKISPIGPGWGPLPSNVTTDKRD